MQVTHDDVREALSAARASAGTVLPPDEGAIGAGAGMTCFDWKGGIGTASRVVPSGHVVGVLVLANFGDAERLTVAGVPVGAQLRPPEAPVSGPAGSCIVLLVTDGPLDSAGCQRLARRAGLGLGRTGSFGHHASGEIFLALATGLRALRGRAPAGAPVAGRDLDPYFAAAVEATEEAVLNALFAATTTVGVAGHRSEGLPFDEVARLVAQAHGG